MKNLIILTVIFILSTACEAQQPLAKIKGEKVKVNQIEEKTLKSSFRVIFMHGIAQYFGGANYFNVPIQYSEILKAKEGN